MQPHVATAASVAELDRWALRRAGEVIRRCGTCQPELSQTPAAQAQSGEPALLVRYIPFERLSAGQRDARDALRLRVGALAAGTGSRISRSCRY